MNSSLLKKQRRSRALLSVSFAILSVVYLLPIAIVLMNSFKSNASINTATFALPNEQTWMGLQNYIKGMTFGNYPFWKSVLFSLLITVVSTFLILLCTSMAAWYVARVGTLFSKIVYYLCVFSMIVPFQMVMEGITLGIVTCHSVFQAEAPSILAASMMSSGTLWIPAM